MANLVRDSQTGRYVKTRLVVWDESRWGDGVVGLKGYFFVYRPDHPRAVASGWVRRSWCVWWLRTGVDARPGYDIHHKNDNRLDDRFENLQELEHTTHGVLSNMKKHLEAQVDCVCAFCKQVFQLEAHRIRASRGKFCSQTCYRLAGGRWNSL